MMGAESLIHAMPYSEFDVLLGMLCYADALDDAAKDAVLASREAVLEALLEELASAAADPTLGGEFAGFPKLILARVTSKIESELSWLREIAAEVKRAGWASMKPIFGERN